MPKNPTRSQRPFIKELPELLEQRGLTVHGIAVKAGVTPSHLNRVLRQAEYKTPSADLCRQIALALDLPADYWPEYRERVVTDKIHSDAKLREELYERIQRRP